MSQTGLISFSRTLGSTSLCSSPVCNWHLFEFYLQFFSPLILESWQPFWPGVYWLFSSYFLNVSYGSQSEWRLGSCKQLLDFLLHSHLLEALGIQRCQNLNEYKLHVVPSLIFKLIGCIPASDHFVEFSELNSTYLLYQAVWLHPGFSWFFSGIWTVLTVLDRRYLGVGHLLCRWLGLLSRWCTPCHSWLDWAKRSIIAWIGHIS